jgi:hypothetical protein
VGLFVSMQWQVAPAVRVRLPGCGIALPSAQHSSNPACCCRSGHAQLRIHQVAVLLLHWHHHCAVCLCGQPVGGEHLRLQVRRASSGQGRGPACTVLCHCDKQPPFAGRRERGARRADMRGSTCSMGPWVLPQPAPATLGCAGATGRRAHAGHQPLPCGRLCPAADGPWPVAAACPAAQFAGGQHCEGGVADGAWVRHTECEHSGSALRTGSGLCSP